MGRSPTELIIGGIRGKGVNLESRYESFRLKFEPKTNS